MKLTWYIACFIVALIATGDSYAQQIPDVTYPNVPSLQVGKAITPISPISKGGAVPPNIFGQVTVYAGSGTAGLTNGNGTSAAFNAPHDVRLDASGNLYVADASNNVIRKIAPNGDVTTFAGSATGTAGSADGLSVLAGFRGPKGLAIDADGNIFVADQANHTIRKITPLGLVTTVAGKAGQSGLNNAQGEFARFDMPISLTVDKNGGLYVADYANRRIRHVAQDGNTATIAGDGRDTSFDARGTSASFTYPTAVLKSKLSGLIYATDISHLRTIDNDDNVVTVAGNFFSGNFDGYGKGALLNSPAGLTMNAAGVIYFSDAASSHIRRYDPSTEVKTIVDQGFSKPAGLDIDDQGNLYVADEGANVIRRISTTGYSLSPALPPGLVFDSKTGTISGTPTRKLASTNYTLTAYNIYGKSVYGFYLEVREAVLKPQAITFGPIPDKTMGDPDFDPGAKPVYPSPIPVTYKSSDFNVAVISNGRILLRGVGKVTIYAFENGDIDYADADSVAQTFEVHPAPELDKPDVQPKPGPLVFKLDAQGHLTLRVKDVAIVTPGAQTPAALVSSIKPDSVFTCEDIGPQTLTVSAGYGPDPADPLNATFDGPARISSDVFGNLFISDQAYYKIRKIDQERRVFTLAGGIAGAEDGKGGNARFARGLLSLTNDRLGNTFVCDVNNNAVRKVTPDSVSTHFAQNELVAANGGTFTPAAIAADKDNNIFVANKTKIFKITPDGNTVTLFAGSGQNQNADGVGPTAAFSGIIGLCFDNKGDLYVTTSDLVNGNAVRKLSTSAVSYTVYSVPYAANFTQPVVDSKGNIFVASSSPNIYKITQDGQFSIYAGGQQGYKDGSRLSAAFNNPQGIAIDASDVLYITDSGNNRIRMITPAGKVTTLAGGNTHGEHDNSFKSNATKIKVDVTIQSPLSFLDTYQDVEVPLAPQCTATLANYVVDAHLSSPCAGGYSVTQSPAAGTAFTLGQTLTVTLHAQDITGQSADQTFKVTGVPVPPPTAAIVIQKGEQCTGLPITFKANATNEGKTATYQWKVNGVQQPATDDSFTYNSPQDKDQVTCVVINNDYCTPVLSAEALFTINTKPAANVAVTIAPSVTDAVCPGVAITFTASTTGMPAAAGVPVYNWKVNSDYKSNTHGPVFTSNTLRDGDLVSCEMANTIECAVLAVATSNAVKVAVKTDTECAIRVPTAFTPNADGNNDLWEIPELNNFPDCDFKIFNRYGKALFHSIGYTRAWDGNYNGKKLAAGTYYFVIDLKTGRPPLAGSVTILR